MEEQKWSEELTPEQIIVMEILSGTMATIVSLFNLLTKNMPKRKAYLCKLSFLETLGKTLKLDEESTNENKTNEVSS